MNTICRKGTKLCDVDDYDESEMMATRFWVACCQCSCEGPKAETPALAAAAWNHCTAAYPGN